MKNKKRLIDANTLMEQVKAIHKAVDTSAINTDYDTGFHSATSQVQGLIAKMPTVDAVEVVRCKKCKHLIGEGLLIYCTACSGHERMLVDKDHFCARGERREGE